MYPATGSRLLYSRNKEVMSDWVTTQACTAALGPKIDRAIVVELEHPQLGQLENRETNNNRYIHRQHGLVVATSHRLSPTFSNDTKRSEAIIADTDSGSWEYFTFL